MYKRSRVIQMRMQSFGQCICLFILKSFTWKLNKIMCLFKIHITLLIIFSKVPVLLVCILGKTTTLV